MDQQQQITPSKQSQRCVRLSGWQRDKALSANQRAVFGTWVNGIMMMKRYTQSTTKLAKCGSDE